MEELTCLWWATITLFYHGLAVKVLLASPENITSL